LNNLTGSVQFNTRFHRILPYMQSSFSSVGKTEELISPI
jgi:hypothetical protein